MPVVSPGISQPLARFMMVTYLVIVLGIQSILTLTLAVDEEIEVYQKLCKDLLDGYDRMRIPIRFVDRPVNVTLYMWPYDILYVNEAKSSVKISGWFDVRWTDHYFMWNASDYRDIDHVFLRADNIWLPMVDIFYSKENDQRVVQPCPTCYVKVDNDGSILSGFPFLYNFPCQINVKYFPFDKQVCTLELANWYLDQTKMDLHPYKEDIDLSVFLDNEEWELLKIEVKRKADFYNYGYFPILRYTLTIKRKPFYYICNLCMPSLIITLAAIIGYHMPSTSTGIHQEKVKMGLTAILSIFILQLGIVDKMPRSSDVIPLISIFYFCLVSLLSIAIFSSSLIILIEKQGIYGKPVPKWLKSVFLTKREWPWKRGRLRSRKENGVKYGAFLKCNCGQPHDVSMQPFNNHVSPEPLSMNGPLTTTRIGGSPCVEKANQCLFSSPFGASVSESNLTSPVSQQPPLGYSASAPWQRSSPRCTCSWQKQLLNELGSIHQVMQRIDKYLADVKHRQAVKTEWCRLADAVEKVSLYGFFVGISLSCIMFIFHGWY